ncbi:MAG: helix-turn-helix domain-containing protein [Chitinophagaceae bacterium]
MCEEQEAVANVYARVSEAGQRMTRHPESGWTVEELARISSVSSFHFTRMFKKIYGCPPYRYLLQCRIEKSIRLLEQSDASISEIALECGFADAASFSKSFRKWKKIAPGAYRYLSSFQAQR